MATRRKEDFKQATVSGLRRCFILQLCNFRLCYKFEENALDFGRVSVTVLSVRIKPWLKP